MPHAPLRTTVDDQGFSIGGSVTATVPAGAATTNIKAGKGRLCKIVVTAAGTAGQTTFYDNTAGSGTVLAVVPGTAAVGTSYDIGMPAAIGITAVGITGAAALTISYS